MYKDDKVLISSFNDRIIISIILSTTWAAPTISPVVLCVVDIIATTTTTVVIIIITIVVLLLPIVNACSGSSTSVAVWLKLSASRSSGEYTCTRPTNIMESALSSNVLIVLFVAILCTSRLLRPGSIFCGTIIIVIITICAWSWPVTSTSESPSQTVVRFNCNRAVLFINRYYI